MILRIITVLLLMVFLAGTVAWLYFDNENKKLDVQTRAQLDETFIDLPAGTVHYEMGGPTGSELVVLVHGFSVPGYIWDPTFSALLQAGYRVLRFDLYGRGHSDRPKADYGISFYVAQLEQLSQALQLNTPFNLIGLSMGGPIVTLFTNQHPRQVKRLVLVDPMVFPLSEDAISPLDIPILGEYLAKVYLIPQLAAGQTGDLRNRDHYPHWADRFREQMQYRGFRRAILATVRQLPHEDPLTEYARLGQQQMPVKVFWGRQDQTIPLQDSKKLLQLVPRADLSIIENAGHVSHFEQPGVFNPLLIQFLKQPADQAGTTPD